MARKGTAIFTFKILIFPRLVGGLQAAAEPCKKQTMWNIKLFYQERFSTMKEILTSYTVFQLVIL